MVRTNSPDLFTLVAFGHQPDDMSREEDEETEALRHRYRMSQTSACPVFVCPRRSVACFLTHCCLLYVLGIMSTRVSRLALVCAPAVHRCWKHQVVLAYSPRHLLPVRHSVQILCHQHLVFQAWTVRFRGTVGHTFPRQLPQQHSPP